MQTYYSKRDIDDCENEFFRNAAYPLNSNVELLNPWGHIQTPPDYERKGGNW